jgi:hypothetical protein
MEGMLVKAMVTKKVNGGGEFELGEEVERAEWSV